MKSLQLIDYFCEHLLEYFGTYQDSLFSGHKFLFHSAFVICDEFQNDKSERSEWMQWFRIIIKIKKPLNWRK